MLNLLVYADDNTVNNIKDSLTKRGYEVHSAKNIIKEKPRAVYIANTEGTFDKVLIDEIKSSYKCAFKFFQNKPVPKDIFDDYDVVGMNFERLDNIVREKIKIRCEIIHTLVDRDRHPEDYPTYR